MPGAWIRMVNSVRPGETVTSRVGLSASSMKLLSLVPLVSQPTPPLVGNEPLSPGRTARRQPVSSWTPSLSLGPKPVANSTFSPVKVRVKVVLVLVAGVLRA